MERSESNETRGTRQTERKRGEREREREREGGRAGREITGAVGK